MKILEVVKTKAPFGLKNGGTLYGYWCRVNDGTEELSAEIVTFTDKIQVVAGAEFSDAKRGTRSYERDGQTKTYTQFTIYAPKQQNGGFGGKGNWTPRVEYSEEEYDALFSKAVSKAQEYCDSKDAEAFSRLVSTYLIGARDAGVKVGAKKPDDTPPQPAPEPEPDAF